MQATFQECHQYIIKIYYILLGGGSVRMCVNAVNDMVAVGKKNDDDTFSHDRILFEKENVVKYRIMQSTLQLNTHTHKRELHSKYLQNMLDRFNMCSRSFQHYSFCIHKFLDR